MDCTNATGRLAISRAILQCGTSSQVVKRGRWYAYDATGRVSAVAYGTVTGSSIPDAAVMSYSYTSAGRLSQYTSPLNAGWGTHYDIDLQGHASGLKTSDSLSTIASNLTYRAFGPLTSFKTSSVQLGSGRVLQFSSTYRSDNSLNQWAWQFKATGQTPIDIINQTMGYTSAGLIKTRTDAADIAASRYYGYDALLRMICEARGSGTTQPTSADCSTSATRLAGLFTYGNGESATSPPDVRLTSFLRSDNPAGTACSSTNRCYLSPSVETSCYASGSAQVQGITRTGSNLVVSHDLLGRRSFEYDSFDTTRSRRDYTYLPNGQLGSVSGRTPGNLAYTIAIRYDEHGHPLTISSAQFDSYELFWDDADRLIAVQITPQSPRGAVPQITSIRWHYHYAGSMLVAATREIERDDFTVLTKRFWAATDERGLVHRMFDSQGATQWQARWDATGWQTLIGTPQPEMWVPFGLPGQILLARTRISTSGAAGTYQEGTEAYASGTGGTWVRPPVALNQHRAADPFLGSFISPDEADLIGRLDPETYIYGRHNPVLSQDGSGNQSNSVSMSTLVDESCSDREPDLSSAITWASWAVSTCVSKDCFLNTSQFRRAWQYAITHGTYRCLSYGEQYRYFDRLTGREYTYDALDDGSLRITVADQFNHRAQSLGYATTRRRGSTGVSDKFVVLSDVLGSTSKCLATQIAHEALHAVYEVLPQQRADLDAQHGIQSFEAYPVFRITESVSWEGKIASEASTCVNQFCR